MSNISRRDFFKVGAAAGVAAALPGTSQAKPGSSGSSGGGDITFVNGNIHTMDDAGSVVDAVSIRDGRIVAVGSAANPGPGARW